MAELKKVTARELPSCWTSPLKCIINLAEFLETTKVTMDFCKNPKNYRFFEKKMVWGFMVDKHTRKISRSTKDTVIRSQMSLGIKPQSCKSNRFFMWSVLLSTAEDCKEVASCVLNNKDLIQRTKYEGNAGSANNIWGYSSSDNRAPSCLLKSVLPNPRWYICQSERGGEPSILCSNAWSSLSRTVWIFADSNAGQYDLQKTNVFEVWRD